MGAAVEPEERPRRDELLDERPGDGDVAERAPPRRGVAEGDARTLTVMVGTDQEDGRGKLDGPDARPADSARIDVSGVREEERAPRVRGKPRPPGRREVSLHFRPERPRAAFVEKSGDRGEPDGLAQNTITDTSADLVPQVARIVAEPGPIARTFPPEQVATIGSEEVQVAATSAIGAP